MFADRILIALIFSSFGASSNIFGMFDPESVSIDVADASVVRAPFALEKRRRSTLATESEEVDTDSRDTFLSGWAFGEQENSKMAKKRERRELGEFGFHTEEVSSHSNDSKRKRQNEIAQIFMESHLEMATFAATAVSNDEAETEGISRSGLIARFSMKEFDDDFDLAPFLEMEKRQQRLSEEIFTYAVKKAGEAKEEEEVERGDYDLDNDEDEEDEHIELFKLAHEERDFDHLQSPGDSLAVHFSPPKFVSTTTPASGSLRFSPEAVRAFSCIGMTRSPTSENLAALSLILPVRIRSDSVELQGDDDDEEGKRENSDDQGYESELDRAFSGFGFFVDIDMSRKSDTEAETEKEIIDADSSVTEMTGLI